MTLLQNVLGQLTNSAVTSLISDNAGTSRGQTRDIIKKALPALLGGLAANSKKGGGANALLSVLDRDHDGSILDDLAGFANHPQAAKGARILKHVLGGKLGAIESYIGSETNTDQSTINTVLEQAAPLLMGILGKEKSTQHLDAKHLASSLLEAREETNDNNQFQSLFAMLDDDRGSSSSSKKSGTIGLIPSILKMFLKK